MPLPPTDKPVGRSANPARIMLNSPLAAAARARVYHQRTRSRTAARSTRVIAAVGSLLVHLLCLFAFVLGPAYQGKAPVEPKEHFMQIRLIEPPPPPPPPPVRGTPPRQLGPRHQARPQPVAPITEPSTRAYAPTQAARPVATAKPVVAEVVKPRVPVLAPTAMPKSKPKPPVTSPKVAPPPALQRVPLPSEPLVIQPPKPTLQPPVPPKFQPEAIRPVQAEGNRPVLPAVSLALPKVPTPAAPTLTLSMALKTESGPASLPQSVAVTDVDVAATPPAPDLQPIPLPAQAAPRVSLDTRVIVSIPAVAPQLRPVQAPTVDLAEAVMEPVPLASTDAVKVEQPVAQVKIDVIDKAVSRAVMPVMEQPPASAPPAETKTPTASPTPVSEPASAASVATAELPPTDDNADRQADPLADERDVSRAPDAIAQGSDSANPGQVDGVVAPKRADETATAAARATAEVGDKGDKTTPRDRDKGAGEQAIEGERGAAQPGADQGDKRGELGDYVQLKPHGDTEIMRHDAPNIGYKPTRFAQDWAPEGESVIDTALRHAVEKTTVKHTFHLPRGIRIECAVRPLMPIALFGCHNPDPPPKPVDQAVYQRLHLAPAKPLVAPGSGPAPAASAKAPAAAPMVEFDNSAACSAARVAGSPAPPGCASKLSPAQPFSAPASAASSWVPASDQFH